MAGEWFYVSQGLRHGPVTLDDLVAVILPPGMEETLVWREGLSQWTPACRLSQLAIHFPPPAPIASLASETRTAGHGRSDSAGKAAGVDRPAAAEAVAAHGLIAHRNDNAGRFCELRFEDGERIYAEYVLGERSPMIFVSRFVGRSRAKEVLWELEWTPENVELFCELFGEPPELPRPAVGVFDAVARKLSEFRTLHEMQSHLGGSRRRPASGEFFRAVKRYLEERTTKGPEAASVGYELAQAAGDPGLDDQALGAALATAASEPAAAYSAEAVEAALRIVKEVTDRRNGRPDYFLVLQALEDGFKDAERCGDGATVQRLRKLFAAVWDVLVPAPVTAPSGNIASPAPASAAPGIERICQDGSYRYDQRRGAVVLSTVLVDGSVAFDVAAARSLAFAPDALKGPSVHYTMSDRDTGKLSGFTVWQFEDGSSATSR